MTGELDLTTAKEAQVGSITVRRLLPNRGRRTIGAWCFVDHMGPVTDPPDPLLQVGPHPHCGLHTVTWLVEGSLVHRDSLGSEQVIRPGQLNVMTAGHGVSHAEQTAADVHGTQQGVQLWVAQPEATRHGAPAFAHFGELPTVGFGTLRGTVLVGSVGDQASAARTDTPMVGMAFSAPTAATGTVPLDPHFEYGIFAVTGSVHVSGQTLQPGQLAYIAPGRDSIELSAGDASHVMVLGGEPFESPVTMWWNFVTRGRDEAVEATRAWNAGSPRFGTVASSLDRIPAPAVRVGIR